MVEQIDPVTSRGENLVGSDSIINTDEIDTPVQDPNAVRQREISLQMAQADAAKTVGSLLRDLRKKN